jgi:hypothetical protein
MNDDPVTTMKTSRFDFDPRFVRLMLLASGPFIATCAVISAIFGQVAASLLMATFIPAAVAGAIPPSQDLRNYAIRAFLDLASVVAMCTVIWINRRAVVSWLLLAVALVILVGGAGQLYLARYPSGRRMLRERWLRRGF